MALRCLECNNFSLYLRISPSCPNLTFAVMLFLGPLLSVEKLSFCLAKHDLSFLISSNTLLLERETHIYFFHEFHILWGYMQHLVSGSLNGDAFFAMSCMMALRI